MPPLQAYCSNKPLYEKQQVIRRSTDWNIKFDDQSADFSAVLNDLLEAFAGQSERRKILDEKARSLVVTLTITATGIIAVLQFCHGKEIALTSNNAMLTVGFVIGLLYFILAGILCVYSLDTDSFANAQPIVNTDKEGGEFTYHILDDGNRIQFVAEAFANNNLVLGRRNNLLIATLRCIRNGLVVLLLCLIAFSIMSGQALWIHP